jgi:hypothetical protein
VRPGPEGSRRRVLVIGSGRRIRNNFLPALAHLAPRLEVNGLWSPTAAHAEAAARPWGFAVRPVEATLASVDTVVVSVSTPAVRSVLLRLQPDAHRLTLVLDTPVFGGLRDLPAVRLLGRFAKVLVAEDYARYPQWELLRTAVAGGLIGAPTHVELAHSGYRYHGLALIRSIFGYPFARHLRRRAAVGEVALRFAFGGGRTGRIVEPYDQRRGSTVVYGEKGSIRFGAGDVAGGEDPTVHRLRTLGPVDAPVGFALGDRTIVPPALASLLDADVPDPTAFNALKTCGLLAVLDDLWRPGPPVYGYRDALYDHLATAWLRSAPGAVDPAAHLDRNFVDLIEIASRVRPMPSPAATAALQTS